MLAYWAPVSGGKIKDLTPCCRVKSLSARRGFNIASSPSGPMFVTGSRYRCTSRSATKYLITSLWLCSLDIYSRTCKKQDGV